MYQTAKLLSAHSVLPTKKTILLGVNSQHYCTGQNYSFELMFAKFATAKNREKVKPTKT